MSNKKLVIIVLIVLTVFVTLISLVNKPAQNSIMIITSPSFENDGMIPKKFTCDGGNINPELQIQNVPEGAKSLALIMHDPDAPLAGGFTHWVVWNVAPTTTLIKEDSVPPGASEGMNSRSKGYTGPCPPSGTHHYEFRLYALDAMLELASTSGKTELEAEIPKHLIEKAELIGLYARQK
jgi:Raf kinase inhibitor-like YbhB/YbcL family protein